MQIVNFLLFSYSLPTGHCLFAGKSAYIWKVFWDNTIMIRMADDVFSIGRKLDSIIKEKDFNEDNVTDLLKALQTLPMTLEMLQVK